MCVGFKLKCLVRFLDSETGGAESTHRTPSSSPCSSQGPSSVQERVVVNTSSQDGTQSIPTAAQHSGQDQHHRRSHRKHKVGFFIPFCSTIKSTPLTFFLLFNNFRRLQLSSSISTTRPMKMKSQKDARTKNRHMWMRHVLKPRKLWVAGDLTSPIT